MKLVILERYALKDGDLDWSEIRELADEVETYPRTAPDEVIPRLRGAQFAVANKVNINEAVLRACPDLQWVGMTSTGTDSLDLAACRRHGVLVANVPGYSTPSVAQCAFALLLELCMSPGRFDASVRNGHWQTDIPADAGVFTPYELYGKMFGVLGYGAIGRAAASIAQAFGMRVLCHTRMVRDEWLGRGVEFVGLDELFRRSDVISLHCPLTEQTRGIVSRERLALCRPGARIVNTARGLLVDEQAVCDALCAGQLAGYAADVAGVEPMRADTPLLAAPNTILTPHMAWTTQGALDRLTKAVAQNLRSFLAGRPENIVNG